VILQWTTSQTPWYLKDLEPAEGGQRTFVYCFFQDPRAVKQNYQGSISKPTIENYSYTLHEL